MKNQLLFFVLVLLLSKASLSQWQQTNDSVNRVWCFAEKDNNLFAGTDSTVLFSTDYGSNWTAMDNGLPGFRILSLLIDDSNILASTGDLATGQGVYLSSNNGVSWTPVNIGLPINQSANALFKTGNRIFVGIQNHGVYYSDSSVYSWTYCGLTNKCPTVFALNDSNLFVGTYVDGMHLSTNNGLNWMAINNGLPSSAPVQTLAIDGLNIFAGTLLFGLFLSTNNGQSWVPTDNDLPGGSGSESIYSIIVNGNNIFVATDDDGVFLSINHGANWTPINDGFPNGIGIRSLFADGTNIYAGTGSLGIWKRPLSEISGIITNRETSEINIFPNPSADKLNIKIGEPCVTIEIIDLTGKIQLKEIINNDVSIDISDLSKGIYIIEVSTKNNFYRRKFIKE